MSSTAARREPWHTETMAIQCGNCRGYFSQAEVHRGKPPGHPWQLTAAGEKVLHENQQRGGEHYACPMCGHKTLVG